MKNLIFNNHYFMKYCEVYESIDLLEIHVVYNQITIDFILDWRKNL